jgi:hypothetical protein
MNHEEAAISCISFVREHLILTIRGTTMPEILYVAERRTSAFQVARLAADVFCAGDSITGWNNFGLVRNWPYRTYPEFLQRLCEPLKLTVANLARKRPSPLTRGKPESWASGIVRVIGWASFLDDPSQPHSMKMSDIDERIGVSEATGSAKAMAIRKLLKIRPFDPEWTLPSRMDDNPLALMIQVNGLIDDARRLPREIQEEAFRKGLIPYIPGDRADDPTEE